MGQVQMPATPRTVALFITCLTDQFYPRVGVAITRILQRLGCRVVFPPGQTCCGQPMFNNGFHDEARQLARHFIQTFEAFDYIVTPSASCCAMVREQYTHLLAGDPAWEHGLHRVCCNTYEFVEFLDRVLHVDFSHLSMPRPTTLTYHYTCHQRGIGLRDEATRLIQQIGNVKFVPLERADQCCGFGGTFAVNYPAISGAMVEDKITAIAASGAEAVVCNDAGCTMNISGAAHRRGLATEVRHLAEVLAEAMGVEGDFGF